MTFFYDLWRKMVNTFFVLHFDPKMYKNRKDYIRACLRHLDKRRLGKQRVEAQQILDLLQDFQFLCKEWEYAYQLESLPCILAQHKKKENTKWFFHKEEKKYTQTYEPTVCRKVLYRYTLHPALLMWVHYEDALRFYINACIDEWCSRVNKDGSFCKNNMEKHEIPAQIKFPHWFKDKYFTMSHQVAMLRKEIAREEEPWYMEMLEKFSIEPKMLDVGYFWPYMWNGETKSFETNVFCKKQEDEEKIWEDEEKQFMWETVISCFS